VKNTNKVVNALAVAAGALLLVAGASRLYAAVSVASTSVPVAIPDNGNVNSTLVVDSTTVPGGVGFPGAWAVTDANLQFSVTHTWDSDVLIRLSAPAGQPPTSQNVIVMQNCGGSGDNFTNTVIDDAGATANCGFAGVPYTGTFKAKAGTPVGADVATAMANFNVADGKGTWTLNAADDSSICTGTLTAWSLTLDGPPPLPVELMKFEVR
jgi:subtilisin-like proprotein convertase family protein